MGLDLAIQAEQNGTIQTLELGATTQDFGQCFSMRHPASARKEGEKTDGRGDRQFSF
jgi:hypothetical protein